MAVTVTKGLVRCGNCNSLVFKQRYCPKCGKVLSSSIKKDETDMDKKSSKPVEEIEFVTSSTEQLEKLRQKNKKIENERLAIINEESNDKDLFIGDENENAVITTDANEEEKLNEEYSSGSYDFSPDKYTLETVQKIAKNVKYESYLVHLLKEGDITKESFVGLFSGMAEETHRLIQRRGELISEVEDTLKGHREIVEKAQQGMKLLDIRRSIEDASEEEYTVKAAALNWDIDHYHSKMSEEEQKATYLKNLGRLLEHSELEKLLSYVDNNVEIITKLNVNEDLKGKIKNSLGEVLTLLKETKN